MSTFLPVLQPFGGGANGVPDLESQKEALCPRSGGSLPPLMPVVST